MRPSTGLRPLLALAIVASATAAPAASLGVKKPSESITLHPGAGGTVCPAFEDEMSLRIDRNGEEQVFSLPAGHVFMITDVAIVFQRAAGSDVGVYIGGNGIDKPIFLGATLDLNGIGPASLHLQTPIPSAAIPCANEVALSGVTLPTANTRNVTGSVAVDR